MQRGLNELSLLLVAVHEGGIEQTEQRLLMSLQLLSIQMRLVTVGNRIQHHQQAVLSTCRINEKQLRSSGECNGFAHHRSPIQDSVGRVLSTELLTDYHHNSTRD